ncbi:MAG: MJ0042-type zinc finger domain-containing protein [Candidatus Thermoplasmatota archaeon]
MRKLFTHCPRCRAGFYIDAENSKGEKVDVTCPYCNYRYGDIIEQTRVRKIKYNWELYDSLNINLISNDGDPFQLKVAGIALLSATILFSIGIISLLIFDSFTLVHKSLGLSGSIFTLFVVLGIFNSYKNRSFVLSFTGSIFAILGSFIFGLLNSMEDFLVFGQEFSPFYTIIGLFLSVFALILIIRNRLIFDFGY